MADENHITAWNNLVMSAEPADFEAGDMRRAAAIVSTYMGLANNGGINSFLTCSYDLDAHEILASLNALGAAIAATHYKAVLDKLGDALPACGQNEREDTLDRLWLDDLDEMDVLTEEADRDIVKALERHVTEFTEFYLRRAAENPEPEWMSQTTAKMQKHTGWLKRVYRALTS